MKILLLHADTKQEIDADIFESVTYILHESFGDKARQGLFLRLLKTGHETYSNLQS